MLRKAEEHLSAQRQHEAETQGRLEAARRKRQEEREKQEAAEVNTSFFGYQYELELITLIA